MRRINADSFVVAYLWHADCREHVESRHAPLHSAYRVTEEYRRSATIACHRCHCLMAQSSTFSHLPYTSSQNVRKLLLSISQNPTLLKYINKNILKSESD